MSVEGIVTRSPIPVASAETTLLADQLRTVPIGGVIEYHTLNMASGLDTQAAGRSRLRTARKIVQAENGLIFGAIRGQGLKRLTDQEIALTGRDHLRKINRAAKRGLDNGRCLHDPIKLPMESQVKFFANMSMLSVFYQVSKGQSVRLIENVVAANPKQLHDQAVLALFLSRQQLSHPVPGNI